MSVKKWVADPAHSEIQFKVKHLMISTVTGYFKDFKVLVETPAEDFSQASIEFEAQTASVDTKMPDRDAHLRGEDFFDSEKYPVMRFSSKEMKRLSQDKFTLTGELIIKDVSQTVSLDVEYGGIMKDPWGNDKAGFSLSGKISRKEWGLNWNAALETGGVLVSDEVKIFAEIQLSMAG